MVRVWQWVLFGLAVLPALTGGTAFAAPDKRVALVIGNGGYEKAAALGNPPKDAKAIADGLRELGFQVVEGYDLTLDPMVRKIRDFGTAAVDADMVMVFYAGHGVQVNGVNFLLPVDAKLADERDLAREAIPAEEVMRELRTARGTRVVILDACRDNPFLTRMTRSLGTRSAGATRGIARMQTEGGSLIAYATKEDSVAEDGRGEHSPYTLALLKHMKTPGLELRLMFGRVATTVKETTAGRQEPFIYDGLGGNEVYLKPVAKEPAVAPTAPIASSPGVDPYEIAFWDSIKASTNPADYRAYLESYPQGRFAPLARVRAKPVETAAVPAAPPPPPTPAALEAALNLNAGKRKEVVSGLIVLDFVPGPFDGEFTAGTRKAITAYQTARGLEATGYLNAAVLGRLLGEAEEARKKAAAKPAAKPAAAKPAASSAPKPPAETVEMVECLLPDSSTAVLPRPACRVKAGLVMGVRR